MKIIFWDTVKQDVSKDFAGGMGIGKFRVRQGFRDRIIRHFFTRDRRPVALLWAHLAAAMKRLGHEVVYTVDRFDPSGDLYIFNPSLLTFDDEVAGIRQVRAQRPDVPVFVIGTVANVMPDAFAELNVTVIKGEAEQLYWKLDEVLQKTEAIVNLGTIEDLDSLPHPDWSPFHPRSFKIGYDFWKFPTALIQQSRGCTMTCNYCPYIVIENANRQRNPEAVVDEIRNDIARWGFRSFKFRDPLFGVKRENVVRLAELIGRLPQKIQFSIETHINLVPLEVLKMLKSVGLTSITVGIESPNNETLKKYKRAPSKEDRQREFVQNCRSLGIRTVAGFLIGFPEDTERSIRSVLDYAKLVGPTFANFNVITPYPGTPFYHQMQDQIEDFDFRHYDVYTPVMKYEHLTRDRVDELHGKCFRHYYFRWDYLRDNLPLLFPSLQRKRHMQREPLTLPDSLRIDGPHRKTTTPEKQGKRAS